MPQPFDPSMLFQFTGTENYYRHSLVRHIRYTDGVRYVAETVPAHWLLDKIVSLQMKSAVRREEFQVWILHVKETTAVLECNDGNDNIIHSENITFTDFPESGIKFYFMNNTILLPSEY